MRWKRCDEMAHTQAMYALSPLSFIDATMLATMMEMKTTTMMMKAMIRKDLSDLVMRCDPSYLIGVSK